jgi:hypothetical protein
MKHTLKRTSDLTNEEIEFLHLAISVNKQVRKVQDNAQLYGVAGRLSEVGIHTVSRVPLGETDEIRIHTIMQESLQSMASLNSDGEVEDIKTYKYGRHTCDMSKVVHTLMHDSATNIGRLSSRGVPGQAPQVENASMQVLLSRLHNISI